MRVELESTDRIVEVDVGGARVPARVWEGRTAAGVACYALVTRIAVHKDEDAAEFEAALQEHRAPSARAVEAFPSRVVL